MLEKTSVLDKVKRLFLLSGLEYCNIKMVAEYFEVDYEVIKKCIQRNQEELIENGLVRKTGKELKDMINVRDTLSLQSKQSGFIYDNESFNNNNILLNRRCILNIAMLLRDSIIAKQIRSLLLDISETDFVKSYVKDAEIDRTIVRKTDRDNNTLFIQMNIIALSLSSVLYKNNLISRDDYEYIYENIKNNS